MSHSSRKYSAEYKPEAIALTQQPNTSIAAVARSLGINAVNLRRWIHEAETADKSLFTGQGNPRDEELARLKRELAGVKKERDFLREAAAYFAKHPK